MKSTTIWVILAVAVATLVLVLFNRAPRDVSVGPVKDSDVLTVAKLPAIEAEKADAERRKISAKVVEVCASMRTTANSIATTSSRSTDPVTPNESVVASDLEWLGFPRSSIDLEFAFSQLAPKSVEARTLFRHKILNPGDIYIDRQARVALTQRIEDFDKLKEQLAAKRCADGIAELQSLIKSGGALTIKSGKPVTGPGGVPGFSYDYHEIFAGKIPPELHAKDGVIHFAYLDQLPGVAQCYATQRFLAIEFATDTCEFFRMFRCCTDRDVQKLLSGVSMRLDKFEHAISRKHN